MIQGKHWTALFSHTGSEIVNISKKLGRTPDVIITNKAPGSEDIHEGIRDNIYTRNKPTVEDYRKVLEPGTVVTLHGWMRIVPPEICREYKMYNLHPGLITKYPELKGKDPQEQVFNNDYASRHGTKEYDFVGCVIHRVSPGVDEGLVIAECSTRNNFSGVDTLSCHLHGMATDLWIEVLTTNELKL